MKTLTCFENHAGGEKKYTNYNPKKNNDTVQKSYKNQIKL